MCDRSTGNDVEKLIDASDSNTDALADERERFTRHPPWLCLLAFSVGPLLMQVGSAIHDSIDMWLMSLSFGSYGVGATGLASLVRFMCESVSFYFNFAVSIKLPMLIGERRQADATQFVADMFRVGVVLSLPIAAVLYFVSDPILRYMGAPPGMRADSLAYVTPIVLVMPFNAMLQLALGFMEGEGRPFLAGLCQLGCIVLNCAVLSPALLLGAKFHIKYGGVPYALSRGVPGIVCMCCVFAGLFSVKPSWRQLVGPLRFRGAGADWLHGMKLASSFLVFMIVYVFPPMMLVHYLLEAAQAIGEFDAVNSAFNVVMKLTVFVNSFTEGFSQGFMASGAYATGASDVERFWRIGAWALAACVGTQLLFVPIMVIDPWIPARIWLSTEDEMRWCRRINRIPFYTQVLIAANDVTNAFAMAAGNAWAPLIPAVAKGAVEVAAILLLHYTGNGRTDPVRVVYVYQVMDGLVLLVDVVFFFTIVLPYVRKQREEAKVPPAPLLGGD